jgi:hypothetical protein
LFVVVVVVGKPIDGSHTRSGSLEAMASKTRKFCILNEELNVPHLFLAHPNSYCWCEHLNKGGNASHACMHASCTTPSAPTWHSLHLHIYQVFECVLIYDCFMLPTSHMHSCTSWSYEQPFLLCLKACTHHKL